jgi:sugar phosphate isomerase/epimerase
MMTIHISIPYDILIQRQNEIIGMGINPEISVSSEMLDHCDETDIRRLSEALKKNGLSCSIHAPFMDLAPGAVDEKIRRVTEERFNQVLHLATLLRPGVIVFHPEYDAWRHQEVFDLWLSGSLQMWLPIVKTAEALGTVIALENVFDRGPEILKMLIEKINSPSCGFCFDTGHSLIFGKEKWQTWMDVLSSHLIEVHLHDNAGKSDEHLPPGDGNFDFSEFFRYVCQLPHIPLYTLEVHQEENVFRGFEQVCNYLGAVNKR